MASPGGEGRAVFHVVVPTGDEPVLAGSTRQLVHALRVQAQGHVGRSVHVIAVDAARRRVWCAETGESICASRLAEHLGRCMQRRPSVRARIRSLLRGSIRSDPARVCVLMNAGFLLADPPPVSALVERGEREPTWCAARSTRDAYAFAFDPRRLGPGDLWPALRLLTACLDDRVEAEWTRLVQRPPLAPAAAFVENSPALAGVAGVRSRRTFDSPLYVNTALREMMTQPQDRGPIGGDPPRMAAALAAQRHVSRVPWVFNTLLNDIEYRLGRIEPESCPPEVHLSVTGFCNIECRFCAYEHASARADLVDVSRVARLDLLRFAQTFRLHSGLGEPTTNKHLARIIEHVAGRFPHLGMNFFTNAVLLDRPGLTEALVGNVRWINASLNASSRESWKDLCKVDLFARVERNLRALHRTKRERRSLLPLVFGSMVLTRANLADLPRMPALCRELGIDRFTVFPYFGLGYHGRDKYGPEMTLEACRREYDRVYWSTVREAEAHQVSLEIPLPGAEKRTAFGLEARPLHDFARVESNEWKLGRFVFHLDYPVPPGEYCPALWRSAGIGSTHKASRAREETHFLYPCIGPLSGLDLSGRTAFRFPGAEDFQRLWRNPVFTLLRRAQREKGVSEVCDLCRTADTRDPHHFPRLERLVAEFAREHCGAPPEHAAEPSEGRKLQVALALGLRQDGERVADRGERDGDDSVVVGEAR
jgi:MoaA/NifB/PqqE/SkfB family radical SAM enzyme